jgi:hypothetical protein
MTQTADYPAGVVASGARGCTLTCAHRQIGLRQGASREIVVHADQPDLYASADQRFEAAGRAGRRHYAPSPSPGPITYREWEQPGATQSADSAPRRVVSGRAGLLANRPVMDVLGIFGRLAQAKVDPGCCQLPVVSVREQPG